ncbi:MAG TPA: hypothetical protein VFW30_02765, partial [Bryocella sp.]|nr:hypothetical protein [Bryocella sp.]
MIDRRKFLAAAAGVGVAAAAGVRAHAASFSEQEVPASTPARHGAPNVLIFMPDQQNGATVLPGSPVIKPNMDRFLKEA